jgi:hypothetical protein
MSILFALGCASSKESYRPYIEIDANLYYHSTFITGPGNYEAQCMGYRTYGLKVLNNASGERVIQDGLILNAKSILYHTDSMEMIFGNGTDSSIVKYKKTLNHTRRGRSALASVSNGVSAVKGEPYRRQAEPDTTLSSVEWVGSIGLNGTTSTFFYKRSYNYYANNSHWKGWLALSADTLTVRETKTTTGLAGNETGPDNSEQWIELVKDKAVYAALNIRGGSKMQFYISKSLSKSDMILVAAWYSVIVFDF